MKLTSDILDRIIAVDASAEVPLHTQLRRSLKALIDKHFEDGDRFFSEAELISHLRISQGTVRRALADLASEGLIERRVAKGSFVCKSAGTQSCSVGVFVPAFESDFWARIMGHISRGCRRMNAGMSIYHTERGEKLADAFRCLKNPPTQERVLVLGLHEPGELLRALDDRGYRAVVLDTPAKGGDWSFVGVDNAKGVELGVGHLFDLGHRDIALVANEPASEPNSVARKEAYRLAMEERGLRPRVIECGCELWSDAVESGYRTMPEIWSLSPRPTALFTLSDGGAWGILRWCSEQGISVPADLSVLGFDDDRPSSFTQPRLSTVAQPIEAIAETAMRMLWEDSPEVRHEWLAPSLVVRESTAAPSASPSVVVSNHIGLKGT